MVHSECADLELPFEMYVKYDYIFYICSNKCYATFQPFYSVVHNDKVEDFNPHRNNYPCKVCRDQCLGYGLMDCIECGVCLEWLHYDCANESYEELDLYSEYNWTYVMYVVIDAG